MVLGCAVDTAYQDDHTGHFPGVTPDALFVAALGHSSSRLAGHGSRLTVRAWGYMYGFVQCEGHIRGKVRFASSYTSPR